MTDVNWLQYLSSQRLSIATLVLVLQFSSAKSRKRHFLLLGFPNLSKTNMPSRPYGLTSCIKNQYVVPAANCSNRSSRRRPEKKIVSMDKNQHTNAPGMNTKEKKILDFRLFVCLSCVHLLCVRFFFCFVCAHPSRPAQHTTRTSIFLFMFGYATKWSLWDGISFHMRLSVFFSCCSSLNAAAAVAAVVDFWFSIVSKKASHCALIHSILFFHIACVHALCNGRAMQCI